MFGRPIWRPPRILRIKFPSRCTIVATAIMENKQEKQFLLQYLLYFPNINRHSIHLLELNCYIEIRNNFFGITIFWRFFWKPTWYLVKNSQVRHLTTIQSVKSLMCSSLYQQYVTGFVRGYFLNRQILKIYVVGVHFNVIKINHGTVYISQHNTYTMMQETLMITSNGLSETKGSFKSVTKL